jgi:hypothetical protein
MADSCLPPAGRRSQTLSSQQDRADYGHLPWQPLVRPQNYNGFSGRRHYRRRRYERLGAPTAARSAHLISTIRCHGPPRLPRLPGRLRRHRRGLCRWRAVITARTDRQPLAFGAGRWSMAFGPRRIARIGHHSCLGKGETPQPALGIAGIRAGKTSEINHLRHK